MSTTDDLVAQVALELANRGANFDAWVNTVFAQLGGTLDDPNSFNATGGKTGALGYYPLTTASGETVYVPSFQRYMAIALGGADPEALEGLLSTQVMAATSAAGTAEGAAAAAELKAAEAEAARLATEAQAAVAGPKPLSGTVTGAPLIADVTGGTDRVYVALNGDSSLGVPHGFDKPTRDAITLDLAATVGDIGSRVTRAKLLAGVAYPWLANLDTGEVHAVLNPDRSVTFLGGIDPANVRAAIPQVGTLSIMSGVGQILIYDLVTGRVFIGTDKDGKLRLDSCSPETAALFAQAIEDSNTIVPNSAGLHYLQRYRSKVAARTINGTGLIKYAMAGDSTYDFPEGTEQLKALLQAKYGDAGPGWIAADFQYMFAGVSRTISTIGSDEAAGWVAFDVNASGAPSAPYGNGPDARAIWTTATTATQSFTATGTRYRIFYSRAYTGARINVAVDGGAATAYTADGANAVGIVDITVAAGSHTISLTTVGSTGRVVLLGYAVENGATGVVIYKMAHHGIDSLEFSHTFNHPFVASILTALDIDLLDWTGGTNDLRSAQASLTSYQAGLELIASVARGACANCSLIFSSPGQFYDTANNAETPVNGSFVPFLATLYGKSKSLGAGFLNWWALSGPALTARAVGYWRVVSGDVDPLHPSSVGGRIWHQAKIDLLRL